MRKIIFLLILAVVFISCKTDPGSSDSTDTSPKTWKVTIDSKTAPGLSSYELSVEDGKPLSSQLTQTPTNPFDFITNGTVDYGTGAAYLTGYRDQDGTLYDFASTPVTKDITIRAEWGFKNINDTVCTTKKDPNPPIAYITISSVDFAGLYCNTKEFGNLDKSYNDNFFLMSAAYYGNLDIAKYLVIRGANINIQNLAKDSPLIKTISSINNNNLYNMVKYFVDIGVDLNIKGADGKTALINASDVFADSDALYNSIKYLVDKGANVDIQDDTGGTALMYAVVSGESLRIVQYLVENAKASLSFRNSEGKTALDLAIIKKNSSRPGTYATEVYNYLVSKNAP